LPLIDDEDFPLDCKSNVLRILQKVMTTCCVLFILHSLLSDCKNTFSDVML
jgi:hypothetical protein